MRIVLVALALVVSVTSALADLRKADCTATAATATEDLKAAQRVLDRMLAVGYTPLIRDTSGTLKASVEATARAQSAAISALGEYTRKAEDLVRELRACAR